MTSGAAGVAARREPRDPPPTEADFYVLARGARRAMSLLTSRWSVEVLYLLASGTRRYSQVVHDLGDVPKQPLTQTLRALERAGLIARRVYPEVPPRVEYSLTSRGWSLTGLLMELYEWAEIHLAGNAP